MYRLYQYLISAEAQTAWGSRHSLTVNLTANEDCGLVSHHFPEIR